MSLQSREVLLAVPCDNVEPSSETDAGWSLGADHEGHGEIEQVGSLLTPNISYLVNETFLDNKPDVNLGRITKA